MTTAVTPALTLDYCGEIYPIHGGDTLLVGRDADVAIDDNPFLHRRFLEVSDQNGIWWLTNVGTVLTATVADDRGGMQAWLAPGARMPIVFAHTRVWFTAGATTYEFDLLLEESMYEPVAVEEASDGTVTIGRVQLTPDQRLLVVALCENVLRRGDRGAGAVPPSADAARRLGWSITKFNRKLDNVCQKLASSGVRGMHGGEGRLASGRRARLIEYAMAARLVSSVDLSLLP